MAWVELLRGRGADEFFHDGAYHDILEFAVTPERFKASRAWLKYEEP